MVKRAADYGNAVVFGEVVDRTDAYFDSSDVFDTYKMNRVRRGAKFTYAQHKAAQNYLASYATNMFEPIYDERGSFEEGFQSKYTDFYFWKHLRLPDTYKIWPMMELVDEILEVNYEANFDIETPEMFAERISEAWDLPEEPQGWMAFTDLENDWLGHSNSFSRYHFWLSEATHKYS